jgi:hypothetical protein
MRKWKRTGTIDLSVGHFITGKITRYILGDINLPEKSYFTTRMSQHLETSQQQLEQVKRAR